jgi:dolichol kinase
MQINTFELRRQVFHVLVGISVIIISLYLPYSDYFLFSVLLFGILLSFLSVYLKIPIVYRFLCIFERDCNKRFPGKGVLFFFMGALLSLKLFPRDIALASIIILTFSDPVSHFVGRNFGKIKLINKRKNIEGTIAGIIAGTLFSSFFVPIWLSFIGSLFAMLFELAGMKMAGESIDDNLLIPLIAGTSMFLVVRFLI